MASVVASGSDLQDLPQARLSLHVDAPPNSSPFPSPSSSFLPPPMPGAHEFAVKPPPAGKGRRGSNAALNSTGDGIGKDEPNGAIAVSPMTPTPTNRSIFISPAGSHPSIPEHSSVSVLNSPMTTPTGSSIPDPLPPGPVPSQSAGDSPTAVNRSSSTQTPYSNHSRTSTRDSNTNSCSDSISLTSTRPAPPSPAISRRASAAPSTTSNRSRSSRPPSTSQAISRNPSMRKSTQLSQPHNSPQKMRRSLLVKIKDFAFASTDDRHAGLGSDVPKPNRPVVLNRFHRSKSSSNRLSITSVSTTSSDVDGEEDEGMGEDGWGGFKLGFGRFSWGFGRGVTGAISGESTRSGEGNFPSKFDFARNFADDADDDFSYDDPEPYGDADEEERPNASEGEEEPLYPGVYRALYAFEPEGTAEMKLEEDQIVRVIGRGGGVGWAVVLKDGSEDKGDIGESKGHALVPESYLEVVMLDEEDGDVADG